MDLNQILTDLGPTFEDRAPDLDAYNKFAMENFVDLKAADVYKALIPTSLGGGGLFAGETTELPLLLGGERGDVALPQQLADDPPQASLIHGMLRRVR